MLYFLTWRDVKLRYKQTALGAAWAILQPLLTMVVFTLFFGRLARVPSDGLPYPIFSYTALVPWTLFAYSLQNAANAIVSNSNLITKVYCPRLLIPIAATFSGIVDFLIAFAVLLGMMAFYGIWPSARMIYLPALLLLIILTSLAAGLWLAAVNVSYRDVRYVTPFLIQLWLFATPIAYPSSLLDEPWKTAYGINPMVGVVEGFRWALLRADTAPGPIVAVSTAVTLLLFFGGLVYFRRTERRFADVI